MGNTIWRTEPISVEKLLDDLRVEIGRASCRERV